MNTDLFCLVWDVSYPFKAENISVFEDFGNVFVSWEDRHSFWEPTGFSIICNSNTNQKETLSKSIDHTCRSMGLNDTNSITIFTEVIIPGYVYPRVAMASIDSKLRSIGDD